MKGLSRALMEKIKAAIADIDNWRDKDTTQAAVRNLIHDTLYDEETGLPYPEFDHDDIETLTQEFFRQVYKKFPSATESVYSGKRI